MANHQNTIVLGAGKLYFDPFDDDGNKTGERYIGDTPGFTVNVSMQNVQVFGSDLPVAELLADIGTQVTRAATITCQDISDDNLGLFALGDVATASQSSGAVVAEALGAVKQGRYYQLGVSTAMPGGVRGVSAVAIKNGATTYDVGSDYELDADLARIYIAPGGAIADDTAITADYTKSAAAWTRIAASALKAARGALRYIADNTRGTNRDMYAPQVELRPSGEAAIKSRQNVTQLQFATTFETPAAGAPLYIEGRPV